MKQVENGDQVKVHYRGTLADGSEFDSSSGRDPLAFTAGSGQVIKGFDDAVLGMATGESKTFTIPAAEAYGEHDVNRVQKVDRHQIPEGIDLQVGGVLQAQNQQGQTMQLVIAALDDDSVTLDANHPLAGKDLTFEISIVEVG